MARRDFVEGYIAERERREPGFGALVELALERRALMRDLAAVRESAGVSQTTVAARMGTSQSAVARIESGEADVRLSTVDRYASALGQRVTWSIERAPEKSAGRTPARRPAVRPPAANRPDKRRAASSAR